MRCIAIDDEPRALEIIDSYCNKIDFLDLVSTFRSPLDAMDYLLKPFEFDRFLKSVIKAKELFKAKSGIVGKAPVSLSSVSESIQIKSGSETFQVKIENIQYVEGLGNYINVYQSDRKITTYISLHKFFDKLPKNQFARIHRSFIVSIIHIQSFENHQVKLDEKTIPIGKIYRKDFIELMKKRTRGA